MSAIVNLAPLSTSSDRRIVDSAGRDVLLRGVNVNSLGEYWEGVPGLDPNFPITEDDWDRMAEHGFSVIRLLVTWSRVEPTRGTIDHAYLDQVDAYVRAAAAHGMYSVIDMHQDAYSAFISTTDPADCPEGTTPAKGWDGAPEWATLTDGLSTCLEGEDRNSSPAVTRAWNHFYDNTDGIRDRFAASWGAIAERFAGRPEVAGFDLLNEPENSRPAGELAPTYNDFLADVIAAIRAAQADAPFQHIVFLEPALPAGDRSRGFAIPEINALGPDVSNLAGSVHNYAEVIENGFTIEGLNELIESLTLQLGVPNWGGEYGFWSTNDETMAKFRRYAADEDRLGWGGAWWQWRQSCGDPHSVRWEGGVVVAPGAVGTPPDLHCPETDGPAEEHLDMIGRGYPRATPGRITELRSDPDTGFMKVAATATEPGGELVVWTPTSADAEHPVSVDNLTSVTETELPGGRLITATVAAAGAYHLWVGPVDDTTPASTTTAAPSSADDAAPDSVDGGIPTSSGSEPATGSPLRPAFTG
ncbi:MAG: cellulase family glycosylhydrolase [Microthrixaceae bacterium]|nr:cellulase family glycosylhydrolase [Microthrixaceae bacterium]